MESDERRADAAPPGDPLAVTAAGLATTLGVRVQEDGGAPPTFRFQQPIHFAEGLQRRGILDLASRRFRTTLWAGDHRCLDHVEIDDLQAVTCDSDARRLIIEGATCRLVLSQQGALTVVPLNDTRARATRRVLPDRDAPL